MLLDMQTLDSAGRGPLGSMASLFQKTRRSLASVGAAVLILLLAFDPFIQQIISYPTRLTAIHGGTDVATTKMLDYFAMGVNYDLVYSSGLWSDNDIVLSSSCSSGNCNWQKFQSSGMCSQCSDVTKSMDLECNLTANETSAGNFTQGSRYINVTCLLTPPQGKSTQFHVHSSYVALSPPVWTYETGGLSWHVFSAYDSYGLDLDQTKNQPFNGLGDPLMVIAYAEIGYNEDYIYSDFISGIKVDKATVCSLELCLLEYDVSVKNGTPDVVTSVLDYGQLLWRNNPRNSSFDTLCWKPTSGPPDITFENPLSDYTYVQLSPVEFAFCGISYETKLSPNLFVGSMFQHHTRGHTQESGNDTTGLDYSPDGDPNALRISSVGLDSIMSNVAKHMNKEALRLNGSDVHGDTFVTEVFVEVQWLWLILPTILVLSGTIFIAIVIIQNKKNGTSLWKSSVLAFFYHGLHEVDKDDSMTASVMEKKAEGLVVQLQESEDHGGLILKEKKDLM
ncbi:hypothetical protein N7533_007789 [Penicillium manginii]|uniref:uncharacterized protein n=1 Tax=Penicillium manginii TaxID=203109 RepID=UPI0025477B4D|nr:uncharacterized protein N7533_007789 [Penicillium manginii]KAJ5750761.1 hypothetical protein N7533_007789 [Penicillium manginii]